MGKEAWPRELDVVLWNNFASAALAKLPADSSHYKGQCGKSSFPDTSVWGGEVLLLHAVRIAAVYSPQQGWYAWVQIHGKAGAAVTVCVLMMGSRVVGGRIKAIMPFSTMPFCHSTILYCSVWRLERFWCMRILYLLSCSKYSKTQELFSPLRSSSCQIVIVTSEDTGNSFWFLQPCLILFKRS